MRVANYAECMCLYPRKMINKKYTATEKNGGIIPELPIIGHDSEGNAVYDERILYVQIPCGQCEECRATKAREWQVRLNEEIKDWKYIYFMTLTFAPKELENLCNKYRLQECNAVFANALRHALERYRKDHKKSLKHWFITELGHEGTERIHAHGLIFSNEVLEFSDPNENKLRTWKYWKYGHVYVGDYVSNRTINYIVKYINKIDKDHKGFIGQILASPGLGKRWLESNYAKDYKYRGKQTFDTYILPNGAEVKLPKYYKNHRYNENEREMIWRNYLDKEVTTISGTNYIDSQSEQNYSSIIKKAQEVNKFNGFGDDSKEWQKRQYNITRRMLQQVERNKRIKEMSEALHLGHYQKAAEMAEKEAKNMKFAKKVLKNLEISK